MTEETTTPGKASQEPTNTDSSSQTDPVDKETKESVEQEPESQSEQETEQTPEEEEEEEEEPVEMVEVPKNRLEELENAEEKFMEDLKRERAESINYRKRLQKQRDEFAEMASARVLSKVLAVQDDLKRVVDNANGEIPESHLEGIQLVMQRLEGIFNQEGVEFIKIKEGETKYDPRLMEAVVSQPIPDVEPNTVIGVINQGFKMSDTKGGKVLRAAKVMISKAPEEDKSSEKDKESAENTEESEEQTQDSSTSDAPDQTGNSENGDQN